MAKQRRMPRYAPLRAALRCRPLRLVAPFCGLGRRMASRNAHGMAPGSLRYALVALAAIRSVVTMLVSVSRIWCPAGTRYGWRIGFRAPARDIEKAALIRTALRSGLFPNLTGYNISGFHVPLCALFL